MKKVALLLILAMTLMSCTENQRARSFGGTSTVLLEPGQELINATWKETDLWLLTKKRDESKAPSTYKFQEDSSYGVMEGTIVIKEQ